MMMMIVMMVVGVVGVVISGVVGVVVLIILIIISICHGPGPTLVRYFTRRRCCSGAVRHALYFHYYNYY